MQRVLLMIVCVLIGKTIFAYTADTIIVHKDVRIDTLVAKQAAMNKRLLLKTSGGLVKGYRIQVITTSSRDEAFKIKSELLAKFPDQKSYVLFQSPYFKVRVGNFLKREDAESFRTELNNTFPFSVYVVDDMVEYAATGAGN
ncbi:SPOR domain-containing protein [Hydrotalea sp.]|uniref:SPOR domain-containing protein n=1 Tax=Hydrotalea sp. TaxID=2881279 RepID=UPI00260A752A|nr:SPOR domain-containing protein [Hydrotalea sp.]